MFMQPTCTIRAANRPQATEQGPGSSPAVLEGTRLACCTAAHRNLSRKLSSLRSGDSCVPISSCRSSQTTSAKRGPPGGYEGGILPRPRPAYPRSLRCTHVHMRRWMVYSGAGRRNPHLSSLLRSSNVTLDLDGNPWLPMEAGRAWGNERHPFCAPASGCTLSREPKVFGEPTQWRKRLAMIQRRVTRQLP